MKTISLLFLGCLMISSATWTAVQGFAPSIQSQARHVSQLSVVQVSMEAVETIEALQATLPPAAAASSTTSSTVLSQLDAFWQTCPYTAAALVCGFKASAADAIAQCQDLVQLPVDETDALDVKRNLAFVIYGALYQGMVHEYVFNTLYPCWFGTGTEVSVVLIKVLFNLLIQTTLVTLPVAYILKAIIMTTDDHNPLQQALEKYWQDIQHQQLLQKCFALWGPVQCLTFSVIPEHYRVTFIAIVSFFWLILLSNISSTENDTASVVQQE